MTGMIEGFFGFEILGFFGWTTLASLFGGWLSTSFPGSLSLGTARREPWERGWVVWFTQDFFAFSKKNRILHNVIDEKKKFLGASSAVRIQKARKFGM